MRAKPAASNFDRTLFAMHDIRNIMATIRVLTSPRHGTLDTERRFIIEQSLARVDRIIADMALSTRTAVPSNGNAESVCVGGLMSDLATAHTARLKLEFNVSFDVFCEEDVENLKLSFGNSNSSVMLTRAIDNLIQNAAQASLRSDARKGDYRITVRAKRQSARRISIAVADNGPGIPPDILSNLSGGATSGPHFGSGIGLPSVIQIVENANGDIRVESDEMTGTVISLILTTKF